MTKKMGLVMLLGVLAGTWMLGCAPGSQMIKSEMPAATPTPTVAQTATATSTETPIPTPTQPSLPRASHPGSARRHTSSPRTAGTKIASKPKAVVAAPTPSSVADLNSTVLVANSMATATAAIATATAEAAVPAVSAGLAQAGSAAGPAWTPTPVVDYSRAAVPRSPVSIGKLFMGIGLLILFGGILYALRQLQDNRRTSRRMQAMQRSQTEDTRDGGAAQPYPHPGAGRTAEPESVSGHGHALPPAVETQAESAPAEGRAKSVPRRRKAAGTPKTPKKAALRAARPAVKTVRLGKRAQVPSRKRRKTA